VPVDLSKPRLLIIGAGGFVGQHLARRAAFVPKESPPSEAARVRSSFEVFEADLVRPPGANGQAIDVTSAASVKDALQQISPQAVVLLAAVSDIDQCEARPEVAESVNVTGAAQVAEACARTGAKLLFVSSAAVFDGGRHGYRECDAVSPVSVYGRTKVQAEQRIASLLSNPVILRVALVLGLAEQSGTNAMLNKFAAKLRAGEEVSLPDFEFRNPIDAATLSNFILELLANERASGIFHLGARETI